MNNQVNHRKKYLKLHEPARCQVEMKFEALDDSLEPDHKARLIWDCVQSMNVNPCFRHLKTLVSGPGRKATNPEVLFALWLLAFTDNIVSSREIVDLTERHDAYRWVRGGVPINHDMLCCFRRLSPTVFEDLLTSCLALMQSQNLLSDEDYSQDGTRIQSAAGRSSGRRDKTILAYQEEARQRLNDLEKNGGSNAKGLISRQQAASLLAAKRRKEKLKLATEELKKAQENKSKSKRKKKEEIEKDAKNVRISLTDPECRRMKMGNGGYSFAYNLQVVTGTASRAIYGISISNSSDQGTAPLMLARTLSMLRRIGAKNPKNWICDSAYGTTYDIEGSYQLLPSCNAVFASKPNKGSDPTKKKKTDGPGVAKWRQSLKTEEFAKTYSQRCSTVELSNARLKKGGIDRFNLIGLIKVKSEALLAVLAHNISICVAAVRNEEAEAIMT